MKKILKFIKMKLQGCYCLRNSTFGKKLDLKHLPNQSVNSTSKKGVIKKFKLTGPDILNLNNRTNKVETYDKINYLH